MIPKATAAGLALLAAPLLALFGLAALVGAATAAESPAAGHAVFDPSEEALADIPPGLIPLYRAAASTCHGLPWQILAGIAKVESNHGRFGGATIRADGQVTPPIIGIPLNGANGTASIPDTDNGRLDRDTIWDRAVGPFQFIPTSWALFGRDGNDDGTADPHNMFDATPAAVAHLCPSGSITNVETAIFGYNHSNAYVATVLEWAARYTGALASTGEVVAGYAFPLPAQFATETAAIRAHHDYPAVDFATPVGTPIFAIVDGTVTAAIGDAGTYRAEAGGRCGNTIVIAGDDGATYTYCHLAQVAVTTGNRVVASQGLGLTGGETGAPGAGNSTGPHLHLAVRVYGQSVCPQPLLLGIVRGTPIPPQAAPHAGCYYPGSTVDWPEWLRLVAALDIGPAHEQAST